VSSKAEPGPLGADGVRICSIADALELIGDRYTMLVLREIALGFGRFNDIRRHTGAPRETLTLRLRRLEQAGVVARRRYREHPPRDEYVLTEAGVALEPVLRELRAWGERYVTPMRAE
jgi:DNA-binding HxlR family transcriptional regulator